MFDQISTQPDALQQRIADAIAQVEQIIVGKPRQIRLTVCSLLSSGHCLIEDLPGVGKTTLAHAVARVFGLEFTRIQFTSDLLPADIIGVSIFDSANSNFQFHPGPLFSHCILADELNRATPKTQSALLEAMEERQVTVDGQTRTLKAPFFVIGTQNPLDQSGTFPLPESQLDRFLMKLNLGYPDPQAERELLAGVDRRKVLDNVQAVLDIEAVTAAQHQVDKIHVSDALLDYVQALVNASRDSGDFVYGLSPRGALALLRAARAWAYMQGRNHVEPTDVQQVFAPVAAHRLVSADHLSKTVDQLIEQLLDQTAIP
jgi:MoxR-like ATPase